MKNKALPRVIPFVIFMLFIGIEEFAIFLRSKDIVTLREYDIQFLYPLKIIVTAGILGYFWKSYREIEWRDIFNFKKSIVSVGAGLIIFALWINLDIIFAAQGEPPGFDPTFFHNKLTRIGMISSRLAGAVLLVPIIEELFWRSFLIRYVVASEFSKTPIGYFNWTSFLVTAVLFGLEHHYILAGIVAGVFFNLLLYYTKSISQCILSHAVANLALGIYVLHSGEWHFW